MKRAILGLNSFSGHHTNLPRAHVYIPVILSMHKSDVDIHLFGQV